MSRIEAGRVTFTPATVDLKALLSDLELMFRIRTDTKQLNLTIEYLGQIPDYIETDEGKLKQVLINLLDNAVKFTESGGIVLRVIVHERKPDDFYLTLEVEDTGVGIADEDMERLFQHFEQTTAHLHPNEGTGLGLAICKEYARRMDGSITVISQVGEGSVFRFEIPIVEGGSDAVDQAPAPRRVLGLQPGQPVYRILVADDEEISRTILSGLLNTVGFAVQEAATGLEALNRVATWKPHLVLMDMMMPEMDGYEAIRRLRTTKQGRDLPVIAVTARAFEEDRTEVLATGADDFISKPFRAEEIFDKIRVLLGVLYTYADVPDPEHSEDREACRT